MKRALISMICILLFVGCASTYKPATLMSNKAYVGMSIQEFKKIAGNKASLEVMEMGYSVYRINDYNTWYGGVVDTKFYYFNSDGKLVKIDGGEFRQKRYQVEIINN